MYWQIIKVMVFPIKAGVYMLKNKTNNKVYVGSSFNIRKRKDDHLMYLRKGNHKNVHLQFAWKKYGEENFEWIVLYIYEEKPELKELLEKEQYWIDITNCTNRKSGYNINLLATGSFGVKRRKETLEKLSKSKTGMIPTKETIEKRILKLSKPILQYDLEGNFIREWRSTAEVVKKLKLSFSPVSRAAREERGTAGGFLWRRKKSEDYDKKIPKFNKKKINKSKCFRKVDVYNKQMEIIDTCKCMRDAAKKYNHDITVIRRTSKQRVFKGDFMFIIRKKDE